jgi:hypothetical protein
LGTCFVRTTSGRRKECERSCSAWSIGFYGENPAQRLGSGWPRSTWRGRRSRALPLSQRARDRPCARHAAGRRRDRRLRASFSAGSPGWETFSSWFPAPSPEACGTPSARSGNSRCDSAPTRERPARSRQPASARPLVGRLGCSRPPVDDFSAPIGRHRSRAEDALVSGWRRQRPSRRS